MAKCIREWYQVPFMCMHDCCAWSKLFFCCCLCQYINNYSLHTPPSSHIPVAISVICYTIIFCHVFFVLLSLQLHYHCKALCAFWRLGALEMSHYYYYYYNDRLIFTCQIKPGREYGYRNIELHVYKLNQDCIKQISKQINKWISKWKLKTYKYAAL